MRWSLLLPLLFVLAGCTGYPKGDSPQAECERQAYDDPSVKPLLISQGLPVTPDAAYTFKQALRAATDKCLRQRGIAVSGGVQPVRP